MLRIKLIILNVLRNGRRSVFSLLAIQFGVISLVIFSGFVVAMYEGMRENMIRSQLGHIQVYQQGFNQYGSIEPESYLIQPESLSALNQILADIEDIELVTERLNFTGLLTNQHGNSVSVVVEGISPDSEALLSSAIKLVKGSELFDEDIDGGLLGEGLSNSLNASIGDYLTLMTTNSEGGIDARDILVNGIISTGTREIDKRILRINIKHAQDLLYTQGVTRVVVLLKDTSNTEKIRKKIESKIIGSNLDLEVKSWSELADYYHEVVNLFNSMFKFVQLIVLFIVMLSISNTMVMAVMERTSEIGTIRAIGGTRSEVIKLFLSEALVIGIVGSLLGILLASVIAEAVTSAQLMMPTPPGSSETYPVRIFITSDILLLNAALGVVIAIVASIYPAIKASRMIIVKALRYA